MLARGKLSVTPSKERCQTQHCHTTRVDLAFGKPPADTVCDRPVRCMARRDIGSLRRGAVLSTTLTYYQSLRTPPTTKRSVRASTARGEAGISIPHGTWQGGDASTALHRAVLSSTLTYYQSLTWLSYSKVRTGQHGTRRCEDTVQHGTVRCCAVPNITHPYH